VLRFNNQSLTYLNLIFRFKSNSASSKNRKKNRKPLNPYLSYDARDTETRENKMGEKVDATVGLVADGTYEVEEIVERKFQDDEFFYLVQWKGWKGFDSWEPMSNLNGCKAILRRFYNITKETQLERMRSIANNVNQLVSLSGKYALYERDVICGLTEQDYRSIYKLTDHEQPLPNIKLLCSHINKLQKEHDEELEVKLKKMVMQREFVRLRYEQAVELKEFVDNLNKANLTELLFIENEVDLSGPPLNFKVSHLLSGYVFKSNIFSLHRLSGKTSQWSAILLRW
jgi:Chromo (CHRromatin Organisation MOdifier) domain